MLNWLNKLLFPTSESFAKELYQILGFMPKKIEFYHQAFCHSSVDLPTYGNNERLEFLGDAILGLILGEALYHKFPKKKEDPLLLNVRKFRKFEIIYIFFLVLKKLEK